MSKRSFSAPLWTATNVADTTAMANSVYQTLAGGSTTSILLVKEIYMGGLGTASVPANMVFARDSPGHGRPDEQLGKRLEHCSSGSHPVGGWSSAFLGHYSASS